MKYIVEWQKLEEGLGGAQIAFRNLSQVINAKEISYLDISSKWIDRKTASKIFNDYLKKLSDIECIIADDCCLSGGLDINKPLISVCQIPLNKLISFYEEEQEMKESLEERIDLQKKQLKKSDYIIVPSQFMKEYVTQMGLKAKIINWGINTSIFRPLAKEKLKRFYGVPQDNIIGLGLVRNTKVEKYFIEKLIQTFDSIYWIILSPGPVPVDYENHNIRIVSYPYREMARVHNLSDFFLSTIPITAFNLGATEAMACNVPFISMETGIFYKWKLKQAGELVREWNYPSFEEAVFKITETEYYPRHALIRAGLTRKNMAKKWNTFLKNIL